MNSLLLLCPSHGRAEGGGQVNTVHFQRHQGRTANEGTQPAVVHPQL